MNVYVLLNENEIEGIYTSEGNAKYMEHRLQEFDPDRWFRIEKHELETLHNSINS
jgi:hypothetical protein